MAQRTIDAGHILITLRMQARERAVGALNEMAQTYWNDEDNEFLVVIEEVIKRIEEELG